MDIIVIGAGIVGMTTAWELARDGHRVTVIDRAAGPAEGASHANGGQLSYSYVAPLADGSIWRQLPKLMLDRDSPVQFRPGIDPFQYRWLAQFLLACNDRQARDTIDRLGALAQLSRDVLHATDELADADFAWSRTGKLVVHSNDESFAAARRHAEHQAASGTERRALDRDACLSLEPALAGIADRVVGGLFSPGDEAADAHLLAQALERRLRTGAGDVRFLFGTTVTGLRREGGKVVAVESADGALEADLYVLAAGVGARALARTVGVDLPIYPLKGYSLSAPAAADATAPRVSITDAKRKVVLARLGDSLRVAGAADLVGETTSIDTRRTDKLLADARADFPDAADWNAVKLWAGLRPATPRGTPILGDSGLDRLLLNVGHGALGLTLAFGSASALAAHIAGRPSPAPVSLFALKHR
ncbi:D-amino acid dehydrogenase [Devosia nitrariae]|uniref:D-amino acid dehydrogenase small subunit n=1 Tax=Devosia nitrariae TaxID=2071872 RepID=A0ABQ5W1D3_9HYPH|nr:D-amino acid dehydrogenase [Devosia nitrariae]GLQ53707.1 D-amino acid dehydrogenase small subunit [Devosia nitrariae]